MIKFLKYFELQPINNIPHKQKNTAYSAVIESIHTIGICSLFYPLDLLKPPFDYNGFFYLCCLFGCSPAAEWFFA